MIDLQARVREILDEAAAKLAAVFREAAVAGVSASLDGGGKAQLATLAKVAGRRPKGAKRSAGELEELKARVAHFIAEHPGLRVEQLNKAIGTTTGEIALPLRKLIGENVVRTKGAKRATTYFAVTGRAAAKKSTRK